MFGFISFGLLFNYILICYLLLFCLLCASEVAILIVSLVRFYELIFVITAMSLCVCKHEIFSTFFILFVIFAVYA